MTNESAKETENTPLIIEATSPEKNSGGQLTYKKMLKIFNKFPLCQSEQPDPMNLPIRIISAIIVVGVVGSCLTALFKGGYNNENKEFNRRDAMEALSTAVLVNAIFLIILSFLRSPIYNFVEKKIKQDDEALFIASLSPVEKGIYKQKMPLLSKEKKEKKKDIRCHIL